jgi:MYXO-CTERM domain-containing protein
VNANTLQTIIAQFVFKNTIAGFSTPITIGYNQGLGTSAQFATSSFAVPAPGAVALLGLAGLAGRRRRA